MQDHLPLFVLNFRLDVVDGVRRLHIEGDCLPREGLDEDLHLLGVGLCRCSGEDKLTLVNEIVGIYLWCCIVVLGGLVGLRAGLVDLVESAQLCRKFAVVSMQ